MKKNILFIVLTLFIATSVTLAKSKSVASTKNFNKPIQVHINFIVASRRSDCNSGIGICHGSAEIKELGRVSNGTNCGAFIYYENGILTMELLENEMDDRLIYELSQTKFFPIDMLEGFNPLILKSINAPQGSSVQLGIYPITKTELGYRILFKMK